MDQGYPPRKIREHHGARVRRRGIHLRRDANRGSPPSAKRRKRLYVCCPEHVLQPRIRHLQPRRIRKRRTHLQIQVQQFQDQRAFVPLLPRHAAAREQPPLDFHSRVRDAPALLLAHVPCDSRLDPATAPGLLRVASHGSATDGPVPVPFDVRRTALHFPLCTFTPRIQVGLRQKHRQALGAPRPHSCLLCADTSRNHILPLCIHHFRAPKTFRPEKRQGSCFLRHAFALLSSGTPHHQLLPGIRIPGRRVPGTRSLL